MLVVFYKTVTLNKTKQFTWMFCQVKKPEQECKSVRKAQQRGKWKKRSGCFVVEMLLKA